jgi:hypothetical protein
LVTRQQAQQLTDRAALLPTTTLPHLGSPATPDWLSVYALYQQTQLRTFADAIDLLFIIIAILTTAATILALFLPSTRTATTSAVPNTEALIG